MCQVHTGAYVSLLASGKTDDTACHPKMTTTYILHVVLTTTHTHDRRRSIGKTKQRKGKNIKEKKEKKRQGSEKTKKERKKEKRQEKQGEPRKEEKAKKGKEIKKVILADPRN